MNTAVRPGNKILDNILSGAPKPKALLYHYTTQRGLLGIIENREIWATHHQCLNDTQEFFHAKELFRQEIAERADTDPLLAEMQRTLDGERGFEDVNLYVASLSEDEDSLAQWRAYGGPASGFSLGFDTEGIILPSEFRLVPCIYEETKQSEILRSLVVGLLEKLHEIPKDITIRPYVETLCRTELHSLALLLKHPKFAEEREWRIISVGPMMEDPPDEGEAPLDFREGRSTLIPYRRVPLRSNKSRLPFPLAEVVVGPNPNPEQSIRSVRSLLASHGLSNYCSCRRSDVPYRNW